MSEFPYQWRNNLACVATYKVLERDDLLDQFEQTAVPFHKAGSLAIGGLRFYPKTTANPHVVSSAALEMSFEFVRYVNKYYRVVKEDSSVPTSEIVDKLCGVFASSRKTLTDLAAVLDKYVQFEDE